MGCVSTKKLRPEEFDDTYPEPDATWKLVHLQVEKEDGSSLYAQMLRPQAWIDQLELFPGRYIEIKNHDLEVTGSAEVLAIEDSPPIAEGDGRVVISRFITQGAKGLARVTFESGETLTGTHKHPIWRENHQARIPLPNLTILPNR